MTGVQTCALPICVCVRDEGYGLHYSTSRTTQGCIRISKQEDLLFLVKKINEALDKKDSVVITVV